MALPGPDNRRNEICKDETGLSYLQLATLVAVIAYQRTFNRPATRPELTKFLKSEEGYGCESQPSELARMGLLRRGERENKTIAWTATPRGSAKVAQWRRLDYVAREQARAHFGGE